MKYGVSRMLTCSMILASLAIGAREGWAQGSLSRLTESVRTPSAPSAEDEPSSHDPKRRDRSSHRNDHYDDDDDDNALGKLLLWSTAIAITAPIWAPIKIADDDYSSAGYFPEYPFQHGIDGYMMIDPWIPTEPFTYTLQARTEYADDFDGLSRIGTHFLFDTTTRFGIDSEVNYWRESLGGGLHDDLWTGDVNVVFRFAQTEWMQMRTGIGVNWLADDGGSDFGINFTYHGDFFPVDPWIISAEFDLGGLGDETLFHGRFTTGLHWHRAEVFVGYDYYEVDKTDLSGFISGVRIWY